MKKLDIDYTYSINSKKEIEIIADKSIDAFTSELLNIGDLEIPSRSVEVLAVIFDLEGFTQFTRQVDPKLAIPIFVSDFFNWLFNEIKNEMIITKEPQELWAELPFFSKFLGDGVLFLWKIDVDKISNAQEDVAEIKNIIQDYICNIIATLYDICEKYSTFLSDRDLKYVDPPTRLRCGIARGDVFSLGPNMDFVGPCINIASRLQKFHGLSFGISARGIEQNNFHEDRKPDFVKKKVSIRGIGDNEIIYVRADEFLKLPAETKKLFK